MITYFEIFEKDKFCNFPHKYDEIMEKPEMHYHSWNH